jgi:hypothetical protein
VTKEELEPPRRERMRVKNKNLSTPVRNSERLKKFRQAAYELLVRASYAIFERMDAVMTTWNALCLAEFSRAFAIQSSIAKYLRSLQDNRLDRKKLMKLYPSAIRTASTRNRTYISGNRPYCMGETVMPKH